MPMEKITQKMVLLYRLMKKFMDGDMEYTPIHEFAGEVYVEELKQWGYMSYELPARFAELKQENPGLIDEIPIHGKSGSTYTGYRIMPGADATFIKDEALVRFYKRIKHAGGLITKRRKLEESYERVGPVQSVFSEDKKRVYSIFPIEGGAIVCTCPGYQFNRKCKHTGHYGA